MATTVTSQLDSQTERRAAESDGPDFGAAVKRVVGPLASLKLTVALFAMAIFIVLAGTFAQVDKDIWEVIGYYFRMDFNNLFRPDFPWLNLGEGFAWIELQLFFPPSFYPSRPEVAGGFYFPKGWLIGLFMVLNLVSAHLVRFKIQARGPRLWGGLALIGVGCLTTWLVIASGSNADGLQQRPIFEWSTLWNVTKWSLVALWVAGAARLMRLDALWTGNETSQRAGRVEQSLLAGFLAILGAALFWLVWHGDSAQLGDSSMRILWQLIKATLAGLVLLSGCVLVFKKRGGVVLLHGGIGLMMFSELLVGTSAVEGQMFIHEGETVDYVMDIRTLELAIIDHSPRDTDKVLVVPLSSLFRSANSQDESSKVIRADALPFDVEVLKLLKNSDLRAVKPDDKNPATAGAGLTSIAEELRPGSGTDERVDLASAYIRLTAKGASEPVGTYLVSQLLKEQPVTVGDRTYDVELRFKRMYKPFSVHVTDVRKDDYLGSNQVRNYSSDIRLVDAEGHAVLESFRIWMNNPLRYAGHTFYQSNYHPAMSGSVEATTLAVVTNSGWMIPYVSCMIVAVGMLANFSIVLLRFLNRRAAFTAVAAAKVALETADAAEPSNPRKNKPRRNQESGEPAVTGATSRRKTGVAAIVLPSLVVVLASLYVVSKAKSPPMADEVLHINEFGKLPVIYEGRVKPFDTLARNSLRVISNKQTFYDVADRRELASQWGTIRKALLKKWSKLSESDLDGFEGDAWMLADLVVQKTGEDRPAVEDHIRGLNNIKRPAMKWLLDLISGVETAEKHRIVRIDNLSVLQTLGLTRREGACYCIDEFRGKMQEFDEQAESTLQRDPASLTTDQRKLIELYRRLQAYMKLVEAFRPPPLPPLPTHEEFEKDRDAVRTRMQALTQAIVASSNRLSRMEPPLCVPMKTTHDSGDEEKVTWEPYATAWTKAFVATQLLGQEPDAATAAMNAVFVSYANDDVKVFNEAVTKYRASLEAAPPHMDDADPPQTLNMNWMDFEAWFNRFEPFYYAAVLYVVAFVLAALAWLGWSVPLNRASLWLVALTLVLHTMALISRIYISGRPPVTNLYSSAVFIGWGCVALGIVIELIFRLGIGNVIASVAGYSTLTIAHLLTTVVPSFRGDTFTVLQAVLDTQFWLATHVVCITLGYATTFLAGLFGLFYVLRGMLTPTLTPGVSKELTRMVYGTLCFAIFFSFVGTVLGGLWADDSWGRFWGWDPKENGALIIVLWNALVLHARWDGLVKERGLAVLALGGNIVTSWSWFGVNELGIGLHSYGFTEGVLLALGLFVASQLTLIVAGSLPKSLWWSFAAQQPTSEAAE